MTDPDAWMSSDPARANQLMSAAQYKSALPKNRECFDMPLYRWPVEITDAMVSAALDEWYGPEWREDDPQDALFQINAEEEMRAALTAALNHYNGVKEGSKRLRRAPKPS